MAQPSYMPQANLRPLDTGAAQAALASFSDVLSLIEAKRDITLKLDVERYVRPIEIKPGQFSFALAEGAPANLPQRISGRLKEWTGRPWLMDIQGGGGETAYERERREAAEARARLEQDPFVKSMLEAFPGAEIVGFRQVVAPTPEPAAAPPEEDED
jgi:DNA polymerase-3 subunit gamma/tau